MNTTTEFPATPSSQLPVAVAAPVTVPVQESRLGFVSALQRHDEDTLSRRRHGLRRSMERPISETLSFDHLEVLVLVENGGATAFAASLGMAAPTTKA